MFCNYMLNSPFQTPFYLCMCIAKIFFFSSQHIVLLFQSTLKQSLLTITPALSLHTLPMFYSMFYDMFYSIIVSNIVGHKLPIKCYLSLDSTNVFHGIWQMFPCEPSHKRSVENTTSILNKRISISSWEQQQQTTDCSFILLKTFNNYKNRYKLQVRCNDS